MVIAGLLLATPVHGEGGTDARGWSSGQVAARAARVISPPAPLEVDLPAALAKRVRGPTLVVYFSPTCPHCRVIAPEIRALSQRLKGKLSIVGVAAGGSAPHQIEEFKTAFAVDYPVLHDLDRAIVGALGARSTPSAVLLRKKGGTIVLDDLWYPFLPGHDALVEMRIAGQPWAPFEEDRYLGNHACAACHVEEMLSWRLTHHSVAWRTLQLRHETANPECTSCHVTGAGAGGWAGDPESKLVDVGCEACHGPGGPHDGRATDAAATCGGCHDAKHSLAFSVAKGVPPIDHFAGSVLPEAEVRARMTALYDGTAPRTLLEFTEGEYAGAGTCVACHEAEHATWAASGHGRAMERLVDGHEAEVACVRCHATAGAVGPPSDSIEGYRVDESVGCESCHGPGKAHVDAGGGNGNIQALGEDCPVCVLEAICTSCHAPEHDPDWNLDRDLGRVGHGGATP